MGTDMEKDVLKNLRDSIEKERDKAINAMYAHVQNETSPENLVADVEYLKKQKKMTEDQRKDARSLLSHEGDSIKNALKIKYSIPDGEDGRNNEEYMAELKVIDKLVEQGAEYLDQLIPDPKAKTSITRREAEIRKKAHALSQKAAAAEAKIREGNTTHANLDMTKVQIALQKTFGVSHSLPDGKKPTKPDQLIGRGIITPKIIESARKARRDRAKARASEQKIPGVSAADWIKGKYGFDTETTGKDASDVPVTFGLSGYDETGAEKVLDLFLSYKNKDDTIANIKRAANLRHPSTKQLVDSAKQLRKKLGIDIADAGQVDEQIINGVWDEKIAGNLFTPEALLTVLEEKGINRETAAKKLYSFKGATFDIQKIEKWLEEYYGEDSKHQVKENLKDIFKATQDNDAFEKLKKVFQVKNSQGRTVDLLQAGADNARIKDSTTLQRSLSIVTGERSEGAHDSGDDGLAAIKVMAAYSTSYLFEGVADMVRERVAEVENQTQDDGKHFTSEYIAAANEALNDAIGLGNTEFDDSKITTAANTQEAAAKQVDALMQEFSAEQQASLSGGELRERFKNRAGRDVSNITGAGGNKAGTTRGALENLVTTAKEKGYEVAFRKVGNDQIEVALIPSAEYDENNIEFGKEGQIGFNIKVGEKGRIDGGRINKASLHTEFIPTGEKDENGKAKVTSALRLETAETRQVAQVLRYLNSAKFEDEKRNAEDHSKAMQTWANRGLMDSVPAGYRGFSADEAKEFDFESHETYGDEGLTPLEAMRSTGYKYREYIEGTLAGTKVKEAINAFYDSQGLSKRVDPYNPDRELMQAMINVYNQAAAGIDPDKVAAMPDNSLTKFLLTSDALSFFRRDAATMGKILPADYTGQSEGNYGLAAINTTSSRTYNPLGWLVDFANRGMSQYENGMALSEKAKEARSSENAAGKTGAFTTRINETAGIDTDSLSNRTYTIGTITQEEYNEAQRAYWKKQIKDRTGRDDLTDKEKKEIELKLQDLTDGIAVASEQLATELESVQLATSRATSVDNINHAFLKQLGVDAESLKPDEAGNYNIGAEIGLDYVVGEDSLKGFAKDFQLETGDRVTGLRRVADGWQLIVEKLREFKTGSKTVTQAGDRLTAQGDVDKNRWIRDYLGEKRGELKNAQALVLAEEKLPHRKAGSFVLGQLQNIVTAAQTEGMELEDIYAKMIEAFPILQKIFALGDATLISKIEYDHETGDLFSINDQGQRVNVFGAGQTEEEKQQTIDFLNGLRDVKGKKSLGEEVLGKSWANYKGLRQLGLVQHNVAQYEEVTGAGNIDTIEAEGRVRDDSKVKRARERNRKFYGGLAIAAAKAEGKDDKAIQRGVKSLNEQSSQERVGRRVGRAKADKARIQKAWHTFQDGHITAAGAKDVEFVTLESLAGAEAKENQIVIDNHLLTDFQKLRENGTLTEDDYNKFIMQKARDKRAELAKTDAAYKKGGIVLDMSSSKFGGKKILLGDIAPVKTQEGRIHPSATDSANAKLLQAALGTKEEFEAAKLEAKNAYHDLVDKDSELSDMAGHTYVQGSSFSVAALGARGANLSAQQANTAQMSSERYAEHIRSASGAKKAERIKNIEKLLQQYKMRSSEDYDKLDQATKDRLNRRGEGNLKLTRLKEDQLVALEEEIIGHIINSIKGGNSNYTTEMGRFPYTQGMEGNLMRVGLDDSLGNTVKLSQGMLQALRGDTDGDKLRMAVNMAHSKYGKDEFAAEQAILKFYDDFAYAMEQMVQADYKPGASPKESEINDIAEKLNQKMQNNEVSMKAKQSFQQIGMFSNSATNMREAITKTGFDSDLSTEEGKMRAFQADIIRAYLEALEQDAISSKKIEARLMTENGLSEEEAYFQVQELTDALRNGNYSGEDGFLGKASKLGILADLGESNQVQNLRAKWYAADKDFLDKMGMGDLKAKVGPDAAMIAQAFGAFESFLKPKGATLADAFRDSKKIDANFDSRGEARADKTYHDSGNKGPYNTPDDSEGTKALGGATVIEHTGAGIIIRTDGMVKVETPNTVGVVGGSTVVHGGGQYPSTGAQGKDVASQNIQMREAGGGFAWRAMGSISDPDPITHDRTGTTANGIAIGTSEGAKGKTIRSVTGAMSAYHKPESSFDYSGNKVTNLGTYSHSAMEGYVEGDGNLDPSKLEGAREHARRSYELGGAGKDVTVQDFEKAEQRAAQTYKIQKELGLINDTSVAERNIGVQIGEEYFGGTADLLTFTKDKDGNYTGVTVSDYKFSQTGGEDDPGTRAERIVQASVYLRGFETSYGAALEQLKSGQSLDDNTLKDLGLDNLKGATSADQQKEIEARLAAFKNARILINRSFEQAGEFYNEVAEGQALSGDEAAEALERALKGEGLQVEKIVGRSGLQSTYFNKEGRMDARPDFVQRRLDKQAGLATVTSKDIGSYLSNIKRQHRLEEEIQRAKLGLEGKKGNELVAQQHYVQSLEQQLSLLKSQTPVYDQNNMLLGDEKLTKEQMAELQNKLALLDREHLSRQAKITANSKEQVGFLGKLVGGLKQQMVGFIDTSLAYQAIGKIRQAINMLIQTTVQLDSAMVNIQIATGNTRTETRALMLTYVDLANEMGRTTQSVAQASNDWLRAGYEGKEAAELTKASMMLSTLGMIEATQATTYLISTLKGWKLSASEVINVVDKLSAVDMAAAVSAGDLALAMSRANNSARLAGSGMNQFIGYVTTVADVTQKSAESVGES